MVSTTRTKWLIGVFLLALVARVAYVFGLDYLVSADDSLYYRELAENVVEHLQFGIDGKPTAYDVPGYPLFLAVLYVFSRSTAFIAGVQIVIGSASVVLLALASERFTNRRAGIITGVIAALYPHLIFWTGYVLTETLYIFFLSLTLFLMARWLVGEPSRWWAFSAGASVGAAALVRPLALGFGLIVCVIALIVRHTRLSAGFALAGLILVLTPWVVRNAVTMESPIVTSTESGIVLWQGNSPGATGGTAGYVDAVDYDTLEFPPGTSEVEEASLYRKAAIDWMLDHPGRVVELIPNKMWNMWRPTYEVSSLLNRAATYSTYPLFMVAAIAGLYAARKRGLFGAVLIAFLLYHLVAHSLVTGMIRFRAPVEAGLTIPAGLAIDRVLQIARARYKSSPT